MSRLELNFGKAFQSPAAAGEAVGPGFALQVSLQCDAGITILFGASGAGKTLTLDAVAGFYKPDKGRILLDDMILFDAASGVSLPPQRRSVGYVFQNYALFPHLTVEQNLAFGIQHLPPVERSRQIHEQLTRFGIEGKASRLPRELSGGEKQRASIARALICKPRLLLLDEPARGLDYPLRAEFYDILRQVRAEHQIPILLVTHDAEEAYLLADRMAVYESGGIRQWNSAEEIFQHPASPNIARLLGIANIFQGTIEALDPMAGTTHVRSASILLTLPYLPGRLRGDAISFCIRRELVRLHRAGAAPQGCVNLFPARLQAESHSPTVVRLALELEAGAGKPDAQESNAIKVEAEMRRQLYLEQQMIERRGWWVEIPPTAVHVFPASNSAPTAAS